jgi:surface carbohydrate biosynthesis protein
MKFVSKISSIIYFILKNFKYFHFSSPKHNKLLVIDTITIDHLKKTILSDISFSSISTRVINSKAHVQNDENSTYFISFKIFFFFWEGLKNNLNFKTSYTYACIKSVKPKIILHMTHDHNLIYLAKKFPKIDFVILCHGSWYDLNDHGKIFEKTTMMHELAKVSVGFLKNFYIIVNGLKEIDLFEEVGVNKNNKGINYLNYGPYEASYHGSINYPKIIKNDILFISQIFNIFFSSANVLHKQYLKIISKSLKNLFKYCDDNNLILSYLCREKDGYDKKEINFVKTIAENSKLKIIKNLDSPLWKEIYASKIIATVDSTSGFDSISIKKKVILMTMEFTNDRKYLANSFFGDISKIWHWSIINEDYLRFKELMDQLISINEIDYEKKIKDMRSYWFSIDENEPSHLKIKKFIFNKINN